MRNLIRIYHTEILLTKKINESILEQDLSIKGFQNLRLIPRLLYFYVHW